jgi:hypothetical protein
MHPRRESKRKLIVRIGAPVGIGEILQVEFPTGKNNCPTNAA